MKKNITFIILFISLIPVIVFATGANTSHQISIDFPEIGETIPLATNDDYITVKTQKWTNETDNYVMKENDVFESNKKYYYEIEYYVKKSGTYCNLDHFGNSSYSLGGGGTSNDIEGSASWHFYMGDLNDLTIKTGDIKVEDNSIMIKNGKLQTPTIIKTNDINYYAGWTDSQNSYLPDEYQIEFGKTYKYIVNINSLQYKFDSNFAFINNNKKSTEENYELISEKTTIDSGKTSAKYEAVYRTIRPDKFIVKYINTKNNATLIKEVDSNTWYNPKIKELNNPEFYTGGSILSWNTKADGTGDVFYENQEIYINKNYELYTNAWSTNVNVNVSFRCDSKDEQCTGESSYFYLKDSTTKTTPDSILSKEGYKITKWITNSDLTEKKVLYPGEKFSMSDLIQYPVYNWNIEFYPYWSNNYHTATFHSNDENNIDKEIYFEDEDSLNLNNVTITKSGYKIIEWTTNPDGTGEKYSPNEVLNINQDIDLYAKWTPITYTIKYDPNGGTGEMEDQIMTYGIQSNLNENKYQKDNYVFLEWNTRSDGKGNSYKDKQSVINITSNEKTVVLYAIYQFQEKIGLEIDTSEVDFGTRVINFSDDIERKVTIKNTGNIPLKLDLISAGISSIFTYDVFSNPILNPNQEYQFTIKARTNSNYFNKDKYSKPGTYIEKFKIRGKKDSVLVISKEIPLKIVLKNPQSINYTTHVENIGWQQYVKDGAMAGTSGKALRLEGIKIKLEDQEYDGNVEYRTHIENIGWEKDYKSNDQMSGTSGRALRLEAIEIKLTGDIEKYFDIYYRVHAENFGWLGWARNGEDAGTAGYAYRLEGIQIKLVPKGEIFSEYGEKYTFIDKSTGKTQPMGDDKKVAYTTHVENIGWQDYVTDGSMAGTSGRALRLEGIKIKVNNNKYDGDILYKTHIQNIGWEKDYKSNDQMSGTKGRALRLEAIEIKLTGEIEKHYDVYYRVHAENFGWLGWAKNGESAGTAGYAYRLEGIEIVLVDKDESPPERTNQNKNVAFIQR